VNSPGSEVDDGLRHCGPWDIQSDGNSARSIHHLYRHTHLPRHPTTSPLPSTPLPAPRLDPNLTAIECYLHVSLITLFFILHLQTDGKDQAAASPASLLSLRHHSPTAFLSPPGSLAHSPSPPSGTPSLTAPLPTIQSLTTAFPTVQHPSHDPALKINWARDVLMLVDRAQQNSSGDAPPRRTRHHTGSPTAAFRPDRGPARRADRVRPTPHANPHLCCGGDLPLRPVFCVRRVPGSRPTQPPSPSTTLTPHEQDTPRLGSTLAVIATFQRCNAYTRTRCQSRELWLCMSFSPLI
jgi:hypothetical protein